ncbi:MAG: PHP domain-containing protein [Intrasporangiaceae bacterium]|nr:PHP domain-containing protein [Intrasporangiaceae bacterium]
MQIDLHTHSSVSDGTEPPAVVIAQAARAGLDVVALTDHDTVGGWDEAAVAAEHLGIGLVRGIEISCSLAGRSIHLLGYLTRPDDNELMADLARARDSRETRMDRMVELLVADGFPISIEQVQAEVADGATLGRPHLADALVTAGIVDDRTEAFDRFLHHESPYYVTHYAPDPVRAVELVVAAGGAAVLAHPYSGLHGRTSTPELIADLAAVGLLGLEVDHRDHDDEARRELRGLAGELGLITTGSSDYHGRGKPNLIGENRTDPAALEAIVDAATGTAYLPA